MTTNWALPSNIEQYSESGAENIHISWLDLNNFENIKINNGKSIKLIDNLKHIARDPRHDITDKTYYLKCTNFNFTNVPSIINGIEVKLTMNRSGRVTDDTVQLCLNGNLIGDNQASLDLSPIKIYGGNNDLWNTTLSSTDIQNVTFGIILRFKSHPNWPHSSNALIDAIEIKVS
jgi:hypothetical protein